MTPPDGELIQRISQSDLRAFDELFKKYQNSVYRFACYLTGNRIEADDLFQETWLRAVRYLPISSNIRDFKAWILTIVANLHKDELRKKKIRRLFLFHPTGLNPLLYSYLVNDIEKQSRLKKRYIRLLLNSSSCPLVLKFTKSQEPSDTSSFEDNLGSLLATAYMK